MEVYDPEKAARVWQRVHSGAAAEGDGSGLVALIAQEQTAAATYLQLSRRFQGSQAAALRRLYEQEQAHAACLKGIYTLITGEKPAVRTPPPVQGSTELILRRCYGAQMQALAQYEQRSGDREYGPVFSRLAAQEKEHCHTVLQLLGTLKDPR